jgi:hypothetical protein
MINNKHDVTKVSEQNNVVIKVTSLKWRNKNENNLTEMSSSKWHQQYDADIIVRIAKTRISISLTYITLELYILRVNLTSRKNSRKTFRKL